MIYIYDFEVFHSDWLVVFKEVKSGAYTVIHNDNEALQYFINDTDIYVGFNSKHYDSFIMKAVLQGCTPEEVKEVNDFIINGGRGWDCPILEGNKFYFNDIDIRDDMQQGLSLKAIEGHLGLDIEETQVDFNIKRPLTIEELELTIKYCKFDVDATEQIYRLRKDYLETKMSLGRMVGIAPEKAMAMTNAKLTARLLQASKRTWTDEREYQYPGNLKWEYIPVEIKEFFDKVHDMRIPDDVLFTSKMTTRLGECECTIAYGGLHGAIPNYVGETTDSTNITNVDVSSYYPSLMINNDYLSRNIPSKKIFEDIYHRRLEAKASGDKKTANALKLVVNTTYGATLNQYNDLYDPLMARSVCISGQLYLYELSNHLYTEIPTLKVIQINTDGVMVEYAKGYEEKVNAICEEWQKRTGFILEADHIKKVVQKDVNNYVEVQTDGSVKMKGGYLVRGLSKAGAFNINNTQTIVAEALVKYFTDGEPVEDTINKCDDILMFQSIAKASDKYSSAYHLVDGEKREVQKINRVYASKDEKYGRIYKIKNVEGIQQEAKIQDLPEHSVIDNRNTLTIEDIDKEYYIDVAKKKINDFIGEEKEMAEKKAKTKKEVQYNELNIYQKLTIARKKFLEAKVTKTGKNMALAYKYFELDDIVPIATDIFNEVGLCHIVTFDELYEGRKVATMMIINADNLAEKIEFTCPFILTEGNRGTNAIQSLGSSITYTRRYLYMIALDICEPDEVDGGAAPEIKKESAPKKPATAEERKEIKKELTNTEGKADELQIKQLKSKLKALREKDPSQEDFIQNLALETQSFTEITREECEKLITEIGEMLK